MLRNIFKACLLVIFATACGSISLPAPSITPITEISHGSIGVRTPESIHVTPAKTITPIYPPRAITEVITTLPTATRVTATPTLTACMKMGGRIEVNEFITELLPDPLVYRIYLPPCYDEYPKQFFPVLYLIHGQTYSDNQWDRLGVPEEADRLIAKGEASPFIVVMPKDRVWREPAEDNFGLAVVQSLIPWVDEHYRTIPDQPHRAIGGLSRGGAWAIHLGLSHPELFSALGVHSGFVFHSDLQSLHQWLNDLSIEESVRIYMDVASEDRPEIGESAAFLEELLTQYDIPHEWHMFTGEHEEEYWQAHVEDYLRWYTQDWKN